MSSSKSTLPGSAAVTRIWKREVKHGYSLGSGVANYQIAGSTFSPKSLEVSDRLADAQLNRDNKLVMLIDMQR